MRRPLRAINIGGRVEFPVDPDTNRRRPEMFRALCRSYRDFLDLLITDRNADLAQHVYSVKPHPLMPLPSVHRVQVAVYGSANAQPDHMHANARMFKPAAVGEGQLAVNQQPVVRAVQPQDFERNDKAKYNMVDDDELVVLESGAKVFARALGDQQVVFCPVCETRVDKSAGQHGKWLVDAGIGTPSAVTMVRANEEVVFYCFSCMVLNVVIECGDQYGFVPSDDEVIRLGEVPKLNWGGRQDVSIDDECRLYVLDAPMGSGKTHAVQTYLRQRPELSVLSITFRQALARYLSQEFGLNCYLEDGFWSETNDRSRCVICLDSLYKLKVDEPYDLVIIDECVFVMYHFLGGTMSVNLPSIVDAFRFFLRSAGTVITMQHRIPESCIAFYMDCMSLPWGTNGVIRRKVDNPVILHPMKVLTKQSGCNLLTCKLVSTYIEHFDREQGRSVMPIVVFTTRADHAALLLSILRQVARERFQAEDRIKAVWAGIQDDGWVKEFLARPNAKVDDADVLVTTSVLQAGHSLDRYFRVSFDFLWHGVLSFREELQFISRLRYVGRVDMAEYKYGWILDGTVGAKLAGQRRIKLDIEQTWNAET
ncbi:hypothetical protein V1520DRAFT_347044 [Lipomyces starkeyi]|uniref:Replication origin-binding protein domain-containing protein n=1 Tax=Lipomyces starkeyi NRRL Y-11557 TaxID=675824 RepID=A0A1E3PVS5_LIPST|nr:hypothetical protein LIPSTDRAFT_114212 [Lipomyces starkeyi NRRL Y-11557]